VAHPGHPGSGEVRVSDITNGTNGGSGYTTKEMLIRLEGKLDALTSAVADKAPQNSVSQISERVATLEAQNAASIAVDRYKRWLFGFGVALVLEFAVTVWVIAQRGTP
jgi:hypothetical protein